MNYENMRTATVMAVHRERYELYAEGETFYGRLKAANFYGTKDMVDFPTVGDEVQVNYNQDGDSQLIKILPRKTVFMRLNSTQGLPDQAVAANFDYVFITMSLNRDFHIAKLERYLTVSWQSGAIPVIILTKADICEDKEGYLSQVERIAPGVDVYCVSSLTGEGFSQLEGYFQKGKTVVLLGSSGVGKSSFVNALLGTTQMLTGEIREADAQGRHTTTYKQCIFLPDEIRLPNGTCLTGGGRIMDTPGMRKLLVTDIEEGKEKSFEDIESLISCCKFSDCQHKTEPGCAVREALENGLLDVKHWKTYLTLQREEAYAAERKKVMMKRIGKTRRDMSRRR